MHFFNKNLLNWWHVKKISGQNTLFPLSVFCETMRKKCPKECQRRNFKFLYVRLCGWINVDHKINQISFFFFLKNSYYHNSNNRCFFELQCNKNILKWLMNVIYFIKMLWIEHLWNTNKNQAKKNALKFLKWKTWEKSQILKFLG